MDTLDLRHYIEQKLAALKKGNDLDDVISKGRLSFGLKETEYRHLPSWNALLKNKKHFIRNFWAYCFLTSFIIVGLIYSMEDKFEHNWLKAIASWIVFSLFATLLYVVGFYFSLFYQVRKTEHEVRKLIYEDLLEKLNKEKSHLPEAPARQQ